MILKAYTTFPSSNEETEPSDPWARAIAYSEHGVLKIPATGPSSGLPQADIHGVSRAVFLFSVVDLSFATGAQAAMTAGSTTDLGPASNSRVGFMEFNVIDARDGDAMTQPVQLGFLLSHTDGSIYWEYSAPSKVSATGRILVPMWQAGMGEYHALSLPMYSAAANVQCGLTAVKPLPTGVTVTGGIYNWSGNAAVLPTIVDDFLSAGLGITAARLRSKGVTLVKGGLTGRREEAKGNKARKLIVD